MVKEYNLEVMSTDSGIPPEHAYTFIKIKLTDVNEPPIQLYISNNQVTPWAHWVDVMRRSISVKSTSVTLIQH